MKTISTVTDLRKFLKSKNCPTLILNDILEAANISSMSIGLTKNVTDVIDWNNIVIDPIRKQFLPFASELEPNPPFLSLDSLGEKENEIFPGLIHRYPNKVLFLFNKVCPAYCSFCTRSYIVGPNTKNVKKDKIKLPFELRLNSLIDYLTFHPNIKDVLISGGDLVFAKTNLIDDLLNRLGELKSLRSIRIGTRGLFFLPDFFEKSHPFYKILEKQFLILKNRRIEFSFQSHFNHRNEINDSSFSAIKNLREIGITIRNQTVLLRGVNSNFQTLKELIEKLIDSNITPYYIYQMDMIPNAEHFRTSIEETIALSKNFTGYFTGFNTPKFVVDLPNGGGKTNVNSYEKFDEKSRAYIYKSSLKPNTVFKYYNPVRNTKTH